MEEQALNTSRNPETVHAPVAAYAHQIEVTGVSRWLIMSGQIGMRPDGTLPDDPIEQLAVALDNISRNLEAADMGIQDLVKVTYYLVGEFDAVRRRETMAAWLDGEEPCSTLIYVAGLATPHIRVEIDAWACR
jgi:2-iminobutanoate/2-iminopropanoate deaminase